MHATRKGGSATVGMQPPETNLRTQKESALDWVLRTLRGKALELAEAIASNAPLSNYAILNAVRTDAKISDAVCWNEQGGMPSV